MIIISNYSLERCYHKALEKDPSAIDSLKTRVTEVYLTAPLDIEGFKEALVQASLVTTVTPTTLVDARDSNVPTSAKEKELDQSNSTTEILESTTESVISTPPTSPLPTGHLLMNQSRELMTLGPQETASVTRPTASVNDDYLIDIDDEPINIADGKREETPYERFQRERREKMRKQQEEERMSAIDRIAIKGKRILYTGYN